MSEVKVVELTPTEIMSRIAAAGASGDLAEVIRLGNLLKKHQAEILKAEADKLKAESEALAGEREKLATSIWNIITNGAKVMSNLNERLLAVKAKGFTYKLDEDDIHYKSVSLTVPVIKERKASGGGGGTGVTVASQTGMSRSELIDKFGTDEEKAAIAKAGGDAIARGGNPNSSKWSAEKPVVKRILVEHPELIKK